MDCDELIFDPIYDRITQTLSSYTRVSKLLEWLTPESDNLGCLEVRGAIRFSMAIVSAFLYTIRNDIRQAALCWKHEFYQVYQCLYVANRTCYIQLVKDIMFEHLNFPSSFLIQDWKWCAYYSRVEVVMLKPPEKENNGLYRYFVPRRTLLVRTRYYRHKA